MNVALALGQPLLVTGEPGTGKTLLAGSIAHELKLPCLVFHTKTTSTATDLFYRYDALRRFQDSQFQDKKNADIEDYITYQALGNAMLLTRPDEETANLLSEDLRGIGPKRSVVLVDEIDKAPRDLPNDVLNEIEKMEFEVKETGRKISADNRLRPILILTSNSEKNLPDAFLRRCMFYHIEFPGGKQLEEIIRKRFGEDYPDFTPAFIKSVISRFEKIREMDLDKIPATAEFLAWIGVLKSLEIDDVENLEPGQAEALALSYSVLAKNREDLGCLKRELEREISKR